MNSTQHHPAEPSIALAPLAIRAAFGGTLMGLANLVPGISGGTMLLASGVYPRFIEAIAELTTLRFRKVSLLVLGTVAGAAALAILLLAGTVKDLVVHHRWIMYSLFIGLTLGGIPVVWRMIEERSAALWLGAMAGFIAMAALASMQTGQAGGDSQGGPADGVLMMLLAGIAGASAMILPGVSGGYLLLVLGVYVPILAGIESLKSALAARDLALMSEPVLEVVLPVGIGVAIGVVVVSNALRWVLNRHRNATLGVLLGLLVGAVVGLWPFQQGMAPAPGDRLKGQTVELSDDGALRLSPSGRLVKAQDYPTAMYQPGSNQIAASLALIAAGFAVTWLVVRIARED